MFSTAVDNHTVGGEVPSPVYFFNAVCVTQDWLLPFVVGYLRDKCLQDFNFSGRVQGSDNRECQRLPAKR